MHPEKQTIPRHRNGLWWMLAAALFLMPSIAFSEATVTCECPGPQENCPSLECGYSALGSLTGLCGDEEFPGYCIYRKYLLESDCDMWTYPDDCGLIIE